MYSGAGSKLSGLNACSVRLTFIFVCWGHALNQEKGSRGSSLALEGA